MKQKFSWGSIGRFESSRSWFTITVALLKFRYRKTMTKTCETTRSEDGADQNSAMREYGKLRQHTADVSKPLGDEAKGDTGL